MDKICKICGESKHEQKFRNWRSQCDSCLYLKRNNPKKFKERFPTYYKKMKLEQERKLQRQGFIRENPQSLLRSINELNETVSKGVYELHELNQIIREMMWFYSDKKNDDE